MKFLNKIAYELRKYPGIKKIVDFANEQTHIYIFLFLITLIIAFNNIVTDVIAVVAFLFLCVFLKEEKLLYVFVYMFFFESVSKIDFIGGSISRILMIVIFIKLIIKIIKEHIKLGKSDLIILAFITVYYIYSILINTNNLVSCTLIYANILIVILFKIYFSSFEIENKKSIVKNILQTIVMATFLSIIYGIVTNNYMIEHRDGFDTRRLNGTKDPNYLAFYINLALAIILSNKEEKILSKKNSILITGLVIGLILTQSITGITINIISNLLILILRYKESIRNIILKYKKVAIISSIIFICLLAFALAVIIIKNSSKTYINEQGYLVGENRIADIILSIKNKDINKLTSGKTKIWSEYIENFNTKELSYKLFGNGINPEMIYSGYFERNMQSHSSYIDILNSYGILGMALIGGYVFKRIRDNKIIGCCYPNNTLKTSRVIMLLYAMELCIYPDRLFFLILLL